MKQFIVDRHTTPNTPTLEQVPTEKLPVYDDLDAAAADLANLAENQIIATHDTGSELSAPVDTVQSGNMHAVTSNAVAKAIQRIKSYFTTEQPTGGVWIDGKPIYRKVYTGNITSGNTVASNISSLSIATIINGYGAVLNTDTNIVPFGYSNKVQWFCSNNKTILNLQSDYTGEYYITLEYTKTTD